MEAQRRANIFPGSVPHKALQDMEIEGYMIPKDTLVLSFLQGVMHNPKDFPDPMRFDPNRFIDSDGKFAPSPKVSYTVVLSGTWSTFLHEVLSFAS